LLKLAFSTAYGIAEAKSEYEKNNSLNNALITFKEGFELYQWHLNLIERFIRIFALLIQKEYYYRTF